VTPFCSCSSIPIFIGFLKAGINPGVAFSFLITSPLVNEIAFVMLGGLFGWKVAFAYAFAGIFLGIAGGMIMGMLRVEKWILLDDQVSKHQVNSKISSWKKKATFAFKQALKTVKNLLPYVLGGVALGALIHGYVPSEFLEHYIGGRSLLSVILAVLVGVPIYAGCSMVVPIIFSISANGVPLGTSLAFMMAIAGLSLPEALILKRVMKLKLLGIFFTIVAFGIICVGYLFNIWWS
jgi:uncharacterized protein